MINRLLKFSYALLVISSLFAQFAPANAAQGDNPDVFTDSGGLWSNVAERDIPAIGERLIVPKLYRTVILNKSVLKVLMQNASLARSAAQGGPVVMSVPLPDGTLEQFQIEESPVMAPELAAKFPEIKTYSGQGLDDPTSTLRFDWTPQGFHAMILSTKGRIFIDPYSRNDTTNYISYYTRDYLSPSAADFFEYPPLDPGGIMSEEIQRLSSGRLQRASGTQLGTYRLAVAATGEYTAYQGGTVDLGMAAIVTAINRVTGIYAKEVSVSFVLVANNNLLVYTNAATDPYTNDNADKLLNENQTNIDAVIGSANYDVGHVFGTGGGGKASLGVPCRDGYKARGETGSSAPTGDAYWVDYVAHELGHQFGANHTFNSTTGSCGGGNRNASTAYEPGSGSTIMAYAGICGSDNLQPHSDAYFHTVSFDEIVTYTTLGSGSSCPTITYTGNNPPVTNAGTGGFYIPANTPFTLTGVAVDGDGDALTYNWEEFDLGLTAGPPGNPLAAPFFRSWPATTSPSRTFPRLSDLLNNTTATGEVLPNTTSTLNFRFTARDNKANGGGVDYSAMSLNVTKAAGPFLVTSPNTAVFWSGNSQQNVTWDVANTTAPPVGCPKVGISLSTDGGLTFPVTLSSSIPNNGSQFVTIPNTPTKTARVKVYCTNNIFFDISDTNFTILDQNSPNSPRSNLPDTGQTQCYGGSPFGVIPCAGTGQDGAYNINPMSYTDNGNGTITDNVTGLVWQKYDNDAATLSGYTPSTYNWYQASGTYDAAYNPTTQNICGSLNLAGGGWRLPTMRELISIVDYGIPYPGPAINTTYFPTINDSYWSSDSYAGFAGNAWIVSFVDGGTAAPYNKGYSIRIRCVRGGRSAPSFTDNGNGTVTDNRTNLMWQQGEPGLMTWYDALTYCKGLLSDWRLPNIKELQSITDYTKYNPAIDTTYFPNAHGKAYFSSTSYAYITSHAWGESFDFGNLSFSDDKSLSNYNYVRCVSGGQDVSSCSLTISPTSQTFTSSGGTGSVSVTAGTGCNWTATRSNAAWITINSGSSGTGNGTVGYSVSANSTAASRTGSITIAGQTFTITQAGVPPCTYSISPASQTFTSSGGTGNVTVTASGSSCAWTATSALSWVTITSGASGTGNGTVVISVSANTTGATRTGNITIAGQTVVITQSAASGSAVSLVTTTAQTFYSTIQAAYNANTAASGSTIKVQGTTLAENLVFNQNNSITLAGGYDSTFTTVGSTMTTVSGSLTISGGAVTVANIAIQ